jgi:hypothetical protein
VSAPLAHVGHWYHAVIYVAPVLLIAAGLWWSGRAADRADRLHRTESSEHQGTADRPSA